MAKNQHITNNNKINSKKYISVISIIMVITSCTSVKNGYKSSYPGFNNFINDDTLIISKEIKTTNDTIYKSEEQKTKIINPINPVISILPQIILVSVVFGSLVYFGSKKND